MKPATLALAALLALAPAAASASPLAVPRVLVASGALTRAELRDLARTRAEYRAARRAALRDGRIGFFERLRLRGIEREYQRKLEFYARNRARRRR